MYVVDYVGQITKYYGDKLKYMKSLGMFVTDNYLAAINYSNAVKTRNKRM